MCTLIICCQFRFQNQGHVWESEPGHSSNTDTPCQHKSEVLSGVHYMKTLSPFAELMRSLLIMVQCSAMLGHMVRYWSHHGDGVTHLASLASHCPHYPHSAGPPTHLDLSSDCWTMCGRTAIYHTGHKNVHYY